MSSQSSPDVIHPVKGYIFDVDGTLLDTETLSDIAMIQALSLPPQPFPWELKKRTLGLRAQEWAPLVISYYRSLGHDIPLTASSLWGGWESHLSSLCASARCKAGALQLVERLAAGGSPLAVATSSERGAMEVKMGAQPALFGHFDRGCIVTGDDPAVFKGKPAPDIFLEAARRVGLEPGDCLAFEDSLAGGRSAAAAGCRVVAIPDRREDEALFWEAGADKVIRSLWEFDGREWGGAFDMRQIHSSRKRHSRRS
mmetsp:Transcript_9837/g.19623  ORF Transcript_9837/g.19623 Transcript_9837/m.19623 type:complete len:255 (+) Transcript_9837:224-988(+)